MNAHVLYRVWPKELPAELCSLLVDLGGRLTAVKATLVDAGAPDGRRVDEDVRRTDVGFWDETHWINGLLEHYVSLANRETWNLDVSLVAGDILIVPDSKGKRATTRALEAAVQAGMMIGTYGIIR